MAHGWRIYVNVFHIYTGRLFVHFVAKMDEYGKGAWIALVVLGFWTFWPIGLATLAFIAFSGPYPLLAQPGAGEHGTTCSPDPWGRGP